ncbi:phosphatase PAP2 family protein [Psychrobacter frigidicola]|uniref:Phosphatase PAP2 family protein n=1 Tax=Psychrobacter frigidicola TaxID=45611 RepID=A0A5C7A4U6_9GAMM|nr:phosphatase PAP2 family protein [Psychrobacter frigidicola]TXD97630.1 phosphatase PAP2 family protein [Psychrobacter frigidicola]
MSHKNHLAILVISTGLITISPVCSANNSNLELAGDIVAVAIPALAYGSTYYKDDKEGRQQFYKSFATNLAATQVLKLTVDKERPNGSDDNSFPSRHVSVAFQGASFIHKRYGLNSSIPAYVGAGFVAYTRLKADEHDATDVLAGAALGIASSMFLTKSYNDILHIATNLSPDYYGLTVNYQF